MAGRVSVNARSLGCGDWWDGSAKGRRRREDARAAAEARKAELLRRLKDAASQAGVTDNG